MGRFLNHSCKTYIHLMNCAYCCSANHFYCVRKSVLCILDFTGEPNVEKVNVFVDSHDIRLPR